MSAKVATFHARGKGKMEIINIKIKVRGEALFLEPFGDLHIGSPLFDKEKFLERRRAVEKDHDRYVLLIGDIIDNIRPWKRGELDKRFRLDIYNSGLLNYVDQINYFLKLMQPIKHKVLGVMMGNHEWVTMDRQEFEQLICKPFNWRYLGATCILRITAENKNYKRTWNVWATHGSYSGLHIGGALNRLIAISCIFPNCHVYLMGHTHFKTVHPVESFVVRGGKVETEKTLFAFTGSFQKRFAVGVDSYFDRNVKPSLVRTGTITIGFFLKDGKVHGFE